MTDAWRSEFPFASHWHAIEGLRYHYVDEGQGPVLLMVHGNPTWSFHFRRLIDCYRKAYRVIAMDHIGCGLSDKPQTYPYGLSQHADNLQRLVHRLDLRDVTLIAQDWGGPIGLTSLVRDPDRFARIVLLNTGAFPPPYIPWRIRVCRLPGLGSWAVRGANGFVRAAMWMAVARRQRMTPAARQGLAAPYDSWHHRVAIHAFVRDIPAHVGHPAWQQLEWLERQLRDLPPRPVQLLWGMRDWCFGPPCLDRLRQIFPHARVATFSDVGHWVLEEAADRVIAQLDRFLEATHTAPVSDPAVEQ